MLNRPAAGRLRSAVEPHNHAADPAAIALNYSAGRLS